MADTSLYGRNKHAVCLIFRNSATSLSDCYRRVRLHHALFMPSEGKHLLQNQCAVTRQVVCNIVE